MAKTKTTTKTAEQKKTELDSLEIKKTVAIGSQREAKPKKTRAPKAKAKAKAEKAPVIVEETEVTAPKMDKVKISFDDLKAKMKSLVRDVTLWTTERIEGQERSVKINFRHHVSKVEAELAKGPVQLYARGIGSSGLIADLANYYINKESDGYEIISAPVFIRSARPGRKNKAGKAKSIPTYDVTFALEGPYIKTSIFEELRK